jgi:hypothetical protein
MIRPLFVALLAGVVVAVAVTVPEAARTQTPIRILPDCQGKPQVRPSSVLFACGDGGVYATGVHWNDWGAPFATATATIHENTCTPNCAQGHFIVYPVYLAVTGRQQCSRGGAAYLKATYVPRKRGLPTRASQLNWIEFPCH